MSNFKVGDKVLHSTVGFSGITKVFTIKDISTWGLVIDVPGYYDPTTAYQLDDGSWTHRQFLRPHNYVALSVTA